MAGFRSIIRPNEPIITARNWREHARDTVVSGVMCARGLNPDEPPQSLKSLPFMSDRPRKVYDRSEWKERLAEKQANKANLSDLIRYRKQPCKNQTNIPYCWIYGVTGAIETVRTVQGHKYVALSACSTGAKIKNFRSEGGWGVEAIKNIAERGLVPESRWPNAKLDRRYDTPENWEEAKKYRVGEWDFICDWFTRKKNIFDIISSYLLDNIPVPIAMPWWGHLIYACDLVWDPRLGWMWKYRNSWGSGYGDDGFGNMTEAKASQCSEACAPRWAMAA